MNLVFDSSSIFAAILRNEVEKLVGNQTLEVARYELGNALWKQAKRNRDGLTERGLEQLAQVVTDALNLLDVASVESREKEVLELAIRLGLTFYDASYVYLASRSGATLVTEDLKLLDRARGAVKVLRLCDLTSRT